MTAKLDGEKIVIGHSLGGRYVSKASMNKMKDTSYFTVNSPFASSQDFSKDLHRFGDWTSLLQFLTDFEAYMQSDKDLSWGLGHSVDEGQVVI